MNLIEILKDSLALLKKEPKAFVPKIVTTFLFSIYLLWIAKFTLDVYTLIEEPTLEGILAFESQILLLFAFMLAILFADLLSYAMYPAIVSAHQSGLPISLTGSLKDALRAWKILLIIEAMILAMAAAIGTLVLVLISISSIAVTLAAGAVAFMAIMAIVVLIFFVVPAEVVKRNGVVSSFRESMEIGVRHAPEVLKLNLLFLLLGLASLAISMLAEFRGLTAGLAIITFIAARLAEALIYAYICVVNPYVYLRVSRRT
ncbi:MAG: hypothetical protein PHG85_02135 [Candidatus Altiarchaeota archaeon]|nr:hypothetical protein [Candidatus Altiarchaeota archaeon]